MAIQTPKPLATQQSETLAALKLTGVTQTSPGGKARAIADIIASKLNDVEAAQFSNIDQALLPYAVGDSVDFIGAIYGIPRIARSDASTAASDGTFTFYVLSGTFGSINSNQDIIIPAGTKLFSGGTNSIAYSVTFATTLPAGSSSQPISATSISTGSSGNAAAGSITSHNFSNYTDSNDGTLLVTNNFGIVSGRDVEDDDSYKYRIQLELKSTGGASQEDLRGQLLTVSGVQDVSFEPLPGTFNAFIYAISSETPPAVLQLAQATLDQLVAFPNSGIAVSPDLIGISLQTTISVASTTNVSDQALVIANAQTAVATYINNIGIGGTFVINNLVTIITQSDSRIVSVGIPNSPIQQIFIWRDREDGTRYSRTLVSNYTLALGERLVVEDITNPINLVIS